MKPCLWEEFNLEEKNVDVGGGIMYCLRYDLDFLTEKRKSIISVLKGLELEIQEFEEELHVVPAKELSDAEFEKTVIS